MSVHLRRLKGEDAQRVLTWRNSAELGVHMYNDHAISEAEHARWLRAALHEPDRCYWIMELHGAPVGLANLVRIDRGASACEWAFYVADPAVRGGGVGSAMACLVLGHVFETLALQTLRSEVLADNVASLRLHERFGFTREGMLSDRLRRDGRSLDAVTLSLIAPRWRAAKTAALAQLAGDIDMRSWSLEA